VEQAIREDRCGREEKADGLIAVEAASLDFAAGLALLFGGEALDGVVHSSVHCKAGRHPSGSITETGGCGLADF
jgi:hypothetical protein